MPHGSVLRIEPVKQKDLGVYECIADNGVGTKARANASLHVYPKTGECSPPFISWDLIYLCTHINTFMLLLKYLKSLISFVFLFKNKDLWLLSTLPFIFAWKIKYKKIFVLM